MAISTNQRATNIARNMSRIRAESTPRTLGGIPIRRHDNIKTPTAQPNGVNSAIQGLLAGSPERQNEAERQMQAESKKQQQIYGEAGRADVAPAREAKLGEDIRQRRSLISEQSKQAGIGYGMQQRQMNAQLALQQQQLRAMRFQQDMAESAAQRAARAAIPQRRLAPGVERHGAGYAISRRNDQYISSSPRRDINSILFES